MDDRILANSASELQLPDQLEQRAVEQAERLALARKWIRRALGYPASDAAPSLFADSVRAERSRDDG